MVHDVIAAIKIDPSLILKSVFTTFDTECSFLFVASFKTFLKEVDAYVNKTLSCGLLGPEIVGTTVDISKDIVSVNSISLLVHKP